MSDAQRVRPDSEICLGIEGARNLIARAFPKLGRASIVPLGEGLDNYAFVVNDAWVVRFPRRQMGADCLAVERRVLPGLRGLPLAIPAPTLHGEVEDYPWPFLGYEYLNGRPFTEFSSAVDELEPLVLPTARFLATLHAIDTAAGRELGAPEDELRRVDADFRMPQARERLASLAKDGRLDLAPCRRVLDRIADDPPEARVTCLCHGDFGLRHVLVDDDGEPMGVVDWGDVHVGDPAVDLAVAWSFPERLRDRFWSAYGPIDAERHRLVLVRAIGYAAAVAAWATGAGQEGALADALRMLDHVGQLADAPFPGETS
ncbi:MAG: phosphotransferase [Gemmatimonadetes bacterium]|nr:phosphotransferase [Gemmatimonadota bacterium]